MGHVHTGDRTTYYMEQLCTIGVCGALGGVSIMMWYDNLLRFLLNKFFHPFVLYAGIALLVLTVIRAIGLWMATREPAVHDHDHDHAHSHDHEHCHEHEHVHVEAALEERTCCSAGAGSAPAASEPHTHAHDHHHDHDHDHDHEHDHGHDHGWNPWRYAVLLLPIVLFFLGMPNQGFSSGYVKRQSKSGELEDSSVITMERKGTITLSPGLDELEKAAYTESKRELFEGQIGQLKGQFVPGVENKDGTLIRLRIVCCAADVTVIRVKVVAPQPITHIKPESWVDVTGQIQFRKVQDRDEYVPVLQVSSANDIVETAPDPSLYIQ